MFMFQITPARLTELKQAATTVNPRISTHDAISTLTWRSVILARYKAGMIPNLNTKIKFHSPTDVYRFVGLDKDYGGNMVYYITCKMPLHDLLGPDSLPKLAALIRSTFETRDKELVAGYSSLCKTLLDLDQVPFGWIETMTTTASSMGSSWNLDRCMLQIGLVGLVLS